MTGAEATIVAAALSTGIGTFVGVWRIGNKIGGLISTMEDHEGRLDRIERHEDAHDKWHLQRGDR